MKKMLLPIFLSFILYGCDQPTSRELAIKETKAYYNAMTDQEIKILIKQRFKQICMASPFPPPFSQQQISICTCSANKIANYLDIKTQRLVLLPESALTTREKRIVDNNQDTVTQSIRECAGLDFGS